ncbi:MAG: aminoglycoside phosphotransferase family protein [Magnetospirillum sp. WYHS-4]
MLPEPSEDEVLALGTRLAGRPVVGVRPVRIGGNNRIWRLDCDGATFALKVYPPQEEDPRDRLGVEWRALTFLAESGIDSVPRPVAREGHAALHEWIEGTAIGDPSPDDIDRLADFLLVLQGLREGATGIGPASAACLAPADAVVQAAERLGRLTEVCDDVPELEGFLQQRVVPAMDGIVTRVFQAFPGAASRLPEDRLALSPSDFGFHNALRRPDGRLAFLDFEYFGWDDPAKAIADVMLHGGMDLSPSLGERFRDRVAPAFAVRDPDFAHRLDVLYPLYGLIWCLILLNEFRADRWQRRNLGGRVPDAEAARARQLARAKARLETLWKTH